MIVWITAEAANMPVKQRVEVLALHEITEMRALIVGTLQGTGKPIEFRPKDICGLEILCHGMDLDVYFKVESHSLMKAVMKAGVAKYGEESNDDEGEEDEAAKVLEDVMKVLYRFPSAPADLLGDDLYDRVTNIIGE